GPELMRGKVGRGTSTVEREEMLKSEKGKSSAKDFRVGYESARGKKAELLNLMVVAKEKKLQPQLELAAAAVLVLDPSDERCRMELGLPRSPFATVDPGPDRGDQIEFRGRMYTPDQLRAELKALGYVFLNGPWCEKIQKSYKIDNLYSDQGKLAATYFGTTIKSDDKTETYQAYDPNTKSFIQKQKQVSQGRYIGGSGTCLIEIAAPGEIIEARV